MRFSVVFLPSFERDLDRYVKKGGDYRHVQHVLRLLAIGDPLPPGLHDHQLLGKLRTYRELHIEHDMLLVYQKDGKRLILTCIWLVTHKKLRERERNV